MEISLKNLLLAGIGSAAYSYEKSVTIINELVKKGELTVSQGKELNEELRKKVDENKKNITSDNTLTVDSLKQVLSELNLPTKSDLDDLKSRIEKLEDMKNQ